MFLKNKKIKKNGVVRIITNYEKKYSFRELKRGEMSLMGKDIGDFIISREDKTPLLNFSVAIDDHLMKINNVLRGEDHITNTFKQAVLYDSFK